jgi:hypothetical protein
LINKNQFIGQELKTIPGHYTKLNIMKIAATPKKGTLQLPVQTLSLSRIKDWDKLRKIFFQFDISLSANGGKIFGLVAYPAYRKKGKWVIAKRIPLQVVEDVKRYELPLPLTLGNLEMKRSDLKRLMRRGGRKLVFTPQLYRANAHAEYLVSDENSTSTMLAKPSPPAPPEA